MDKHSIEDVPPPKINLLLERLQNTATMVQAEEELLGLGERAIPILESILNGEAINRFGVPFRQLGLPLVCAMEVASRLGNRAKRLEPYLRTELLRGDRAAVMALRSIDTLDEATIVALAACLNTNDELGYEAALTLVLCSVEKHPAVLDVISDSKQALVLFTQVTSYCERRNKPSG